YVFFAIPVIGALANDPLRFLERTAKIQWGITVCVYGMSHAPALLLLELPNWRERGAFLVFYLVVVVATAQLAQEVASRRPPRRRGDRRRAGGGRRRFALLDDAVQAAAGAGHGRDRRRHRHARRVRDESAQA